MSVQYTQANRALAVKVDGLDLDALLLVGCKGEEEISQLFRYQLDLVAENPANIPFEKLLGQSVTIELELAGSRLPREKKRFFNGICQRVTQGERDENLTHFQMDIVPQVWLLTKITRSRVFQHLTAWDILQQVFDGTDALFNMQVDLPEREYCVQYRESDFAFASRLMAEEGIVYYFKHDDGKHTMVLRADPQYRDDMTPATVTYSNTRRDPYNVRRWEKVQELRAGMVSFRDHTFEKPEATLEVNRPVLKEIAVGMVTHKLNSINSELELYDYPGPYAKRFDEIDRNGSEDTTESAKIYPDGERTVRIAMERETTAAVAIHGESDCRHFVAGQTFTLQSDPYTREQQAQADGLYLLTGVEHRIEQPLPDTSNNNGKGFSYQNSFNCAPAALTYRPRWTEPKPVILGPQTAVVVGPPGQELYVDKYGRVKVQFFWDREGTTDLDSSCWVRVAQASAGTRFGAHFWPRIGHEVVVAFEEGDPDRPLIVGSVYNAANMPPYELAKNQTRSGIKTHSTPNATPQNFNEIRFEDKKGQEEIYVQAECNLNTVVKSCEGRAVGGSRDTTIYHGERLTVKDDGRVTQIEKGNEELIVYEGLRFTSIQKGDDRLYVAGARDTQIDTGERLLVKDGGRQTTIQTGDEVLNVQEGSRTTTIEKGHDFLEVKTGGVGVKVEGDYFVNSNKKITLVATEEIALIVGDSHIRLTPNCIYVNGGQVVGITAPNNVAVNSKLIDLNS
jgi:type VI secretion system secreted protein VgrG